MPHLTGFRTGQTFKGENVLATVSYDALSKVSDSCPITEQKRRKSHILRAGITSGMKTRGPGSWVKETTYSLHDPKHTCFATPSSSYRSTFVEKEEQRTAPIRPPDNNLQFGKLAPLYRSVTASDYIYIPGEKRTMCLPPVGSRDVMRGSYADGFVTTARTYFTAKDHRQSSLGCGRAGIPLTERPMYNIITGGSQMSNLRHEFWDVRSDYRRAKKPL